MDDSDEQSQQDIVVIRLDGNEAVVLFELLSRWAASENSATPTSECFKNSAEGAVLLGLLAELEKQLVAPFKSDYQHILQKARYALEHRWESATLSRD